MGTYIGKNYTRYDTDDIEALCAYVIPKIKADPAVQKRNIQGDGVGEPTTLSTFSPPQDQELERFADPTPCTSPPLSGSYWPRLPAQLQILAPARVDALVGDLESLAAASGGDPKLHSIAVSKVVLALTMRAGICFLRPAQNWKDDDVRLQQEVKRHVAASGLIVRIHRTCRDKVEKLTKEESISRLKSIYQHGNTRYKLQYQENDLHSLLDKIKDDWLDHEQQRARWVKAGGGGERAGYSPSEMLRSLLRDVERWERSVAERAKMEKQ